MTPSILDTFLAAHTALTRATAAEMEEASHIDDELQQLPAGGFTLARAMLTGRAADVQVRLVTSRRAIVAEYAALLCLRTDDSGGCDIDLPAKRPAGRPTKTEAAARAKVGSETTAAPTSPTGDPAADSALATAADAFMASVSDDRTPAQVRLVLSDLDWAVDEMSQYSDTALAFAAKHGLKPSEVTRTDDGGMQIGVDGDVIP